MDRFDAVLDTAIESTAEAFLNRPANFSDERAPSDADQNAIPDDHPANDLADLPIPYRWRDEHGNGEEVASVELYPVWEGDPRLARTLDGVDRTDRADALMIDQRTSDSRTL